MKNIDEVIRRQKGRFSVISLIDEMVENDEIAEDEIDFAFDVARKGVVYYYKCGFLGLYPDKEEFFWRIYRNV